ncbi:hypothetical protein [Bacteroides sp.]|uniref:hypothetical protein n=1 Tax=Bacteroides sp. TaxID=29523 RepID=UPI00260C9CEB|nr:hypothetical protein [Bacteroides sp.]
MKQIYLFSISLLIFLLVNAISAKADVLGPYIMDDNAPDIRVGYGRIVCVMQATTPITGSITIRDEKGIQYVLRAHEPGSAPYCYFVAYGTYSVVGMECSTITSNWGPLQIGSIFTVAGSTGYVGLTNTDQTPSIIQATGTDDNTPPTKNGYATMKVYGIGANGSGTLVDSDGKEYSIYNYTAHTGGAHYFYIKSATYTVKTIGTNGSYVYIDIDGIKKYLSGGVSFSVPSTGSNVSIVFSTTPF